MHPSIDAPMLRSPVRSLAAVVWLTFTGAATTPAPVAAPRFEITVASSAHSGPLTGRLIVAVAKTNQNEPRLTINPRGPAMFAVDLQQLAPGATAVVDEKALGYPFPLADLPPGDY